MDPAFKNDIKTLLLHGKRFIFFCFFLGQKCSSQRVDKKTDHILSSSSDKSYLHD